MSNPTFQRGQMEWALWRQFGQRFGDPSINQAPPVFLNRIKRMLELDKDKSATVFTDSSSGGQGHAADYTHFSVFLMGLALVLLDAGFKQSDALFLLQHIKGRLDAPFQWIKDSPPAPRQQILHRDQPQSPKHPLNPNSADTSVFLLIRKVEMLECWPQQEKRREPFIFGPKFCRGLTELMKEMDRLNYDYPNTMVIELADMAVMIEGHLKNAPPSKRGRKNKPPETMV